MRAVTREQKLALIVGFSLILLVGVLISDHLSRARALQVAHFDTEEPGIAANSGPNLPDAVHPTVLTQPPAEPQPTLASNPPPSSVAPESQPDPQPGTIPMGPVTADRQVAGMTSPGGPPISGLSDDARRLLDDLRTGIQTSGVSEVPPLVGVEQPNPGATLPLVQPKPERPATIWYTVKPKDTLYQIALKHYGDAKAWRQLVELNKDRVSPDGAVHAGVRIELYEKLPGGPALTPVAPPATKPKATPRPALTDQRIATADQPAKTDKPTAARTYKVQKGDSLGVISQRLLGTVKRTNEILALNRGVVEDEDSIRVGMVLTMPPR
jgi:nucleoid-associated protein YgaU